MLSELAEAAAQLQQQRSALPSYYKIKSVHWVVEITGAVGRLLGPYRGRTALRYAVPDRQRSGTNAPPYLLVDDARYTLGISEPGKEAAARRFHEAFQQLLAEAAAATQDPDVTAVLDFLRRGAPLDPADRRPEIQPKDYVAFTLASASQFLWDKPAIQQFWGEYLARDRAAASDGICLVCGARRPLLRRLPEEIVLAGQKCQIVSFNKPAFESHGREETTNAPLCAACAARFTTALKFLIADDRHHQTLTAPSRLDRGGTRTRPLQSVVAVFWLREPVSVPALAPEETVDGDLVIPLGAPLTPPPPALDGPPPALSQLARLLDLPWHTQAAALRLAENAFYLAVLTPNKGRLMVRDWMVTAVTDTLEHLRTFVRAVTIVTPDGQQTAPLPIPALLAAVRADDPNLMRGMLRTAYQGYDLPPGVTAAALRQARLPHPWRPAPRLAQDAQKQVAALHALAAALKLSWWALRGKEDPQRMTQLEVDNPSPAYRCGRLLALLEEAQRRSTARPGGQRAPASTLTERFVGAALQSPHVILKDLLPLAERAYLPKLRRTQRTAADALQQAIEEVMGGLHAASLPRAFSAPHQVEFVLGLYHQRAALRAERQARAQRNTARAASAQTDSEGA